MASQKKPCAMRVKRLTRPLLVTIWDILVPAVCKCLIESEDFLGLVLNSFAHASSQEGFFHLVWDAVLQIEREKGEHPRPWRRLIA
jgi:hypothetical protein